MDAQVFFTEPITCYFLDGILIIYCVVVTAFFFKEKFSFIPPVAGVSQVENGAIYQELQRPNDADPYQVLESSKRKKKAGKKKKEPTQPAEMDKELYESLVPPLMSCTVPPVSRGSTAN